MALTDVGGTPVIQTGYGCNGDGFGWGNSGILGIILIIALLGGGGFGGFGFGNRGGFGLANMDNTVWGAQQFAQLDNGIRAVQNGICDSVYALNNSVKDGFYATQTAIQGVTQILETLYALQLTN